MNNAFDYVQEKGITTEGEYPYQTEQGDCEKDGGNFKISGAISIIGCTALANSIQSRPVSVVVDASNWSSYMGGVLN